MKIIIVLVESNLSGVINAFENVVPVKKYALPVSRMKNVAMKMIFVCLINLILKVD